MDLYQFTQDLADRFPLDGPGWPFTCHGSPFDCPVFLVGLNPATDTPFRPFWDPSYGFDKYGWLDECRRRSSDGDLPTTRQKLEWIGEGAEEYSVRCLETNVYTPATRRYRDLTAEGRSTDVFDFLLNELQPGVIFVHGNDAIDCIGSLTGTALELQRSLQASSEFVRVQLFYGDVDVLPSPHLSRKWSKDACRGLGRRLAERVRGLG